MAEEGKQEANSDLARKSKVESSPVEDIESKEKDKQSNEAFGKDIPEPTLDEGTAKLQEPSLEPDTERFEEHSSLKKEPLGRLRTEIFRGKITMERSDCIGIAFLMGIENLSAFEQKIRGSDYPLFLLIEEAERTKVGDDNVDALIEALKAISFRSNECQRALEVVEKYKHQCCESNTKQNIPQVKNELHTTKENIYIKSLNEWCEQKGLEVGKLKGKDINDFLDTIDVKPQSLRPYYEKNLHRLCLPEKDKDEVKEHLKELTKKKKEPPKK